MYTQLSSRTDSGIILSSSVDDFFKKQTQFANKTDSGIILSSSVDNFLLNGPESEQQREENKNREKLFMVHGKDPGFTWGESLFEDIDDLFEKGLIAICPRFPTIKDDKKHIKEWYKVFDKYANLGLLNENTTLITYSLGTIPSIQFIVDTGLKIKTNIAVSPLMGNIRKKNVRDLINQIVLKYIFGYKLTERTLERAQDLVTNRHVIISNNDHWIKEKELRRYAKAYGAQIHFRPNQGHFSQKNNVTHIDGLSDLVYSSAHTPAGKKFHI